MHTPRPLSILLILLLALAGCAADEEAEEGAGQDAAGDARGADDLGDVSASSGATTSSSSSGDASPTPDMANTTDTSTPPQDTSPVGISCPPSGPYGDEVGEVVADLELPDCDGVMHSLHDLCDAPASWVAYYAGWCPNCNNFAASAEDFYQTRAARGLQAFYVITEDTSYAPPTAAYCREIRDRFGFTMPVLYDADGLLEQSFSGIGPNDSHVVMTHGNIITFKGKYRTSQLAGAIEAALAE